MKIISDLSPALHDFEPSVDSFFDELLLGLSGNPKSIPAKFFYDQTGCELFDQICCVDEYYPTRTEMQILRDNVAEICTLFGPECRLVELGSGSSAKTRILLDHLYEPAAYVPIDIARDHLLRSTARLTRIYPKLRVAPVCADFTRPLTLPKPPYSMQRTVAFFPGSTIGNLEPAQAVKFLRRIAKLCGAGGGLLIGVDLKKDRGTLERAYNDSTGVTAAFNLNLLARINRELGGTFDLKAFEHEARYNQHEQRIEMHLRSTVDQTASIKDFTVSLKKGETIWTESSYKFRPEQVRVMAEQGGFNTEVQWIDAEWPFAQTLLRVV